MKTVVLVTGCDVPREMLASEPPQALYVNGILLMQRPGRVRMRNTAARIHWLRGLVGPAESRLVSMERLLAARGTLKFPRRLADIDSVEGAWLPLPPGGSGLV